MILIMRNEPNLRQSQIFITAIITMTCNEKRKLDTWSKRTQTNPIYSELVESTYPNPSSCLLHQRLKTKLLEHPPQKFHRQPHHICQTPLYSLDKCVPALLNRIRPRLVPPGLALNMPRYLLISQRLRVNRRALAFYNLHAVRY